MASVGAPGYLFVKSTLGFHGKLSRYSRAFWSVTKLLPSFSGVPITAKITAN